MSDTAPNLRQQIIDLFMNSASVYAAADAVLALTDREPRLGIGGNSPPEEIETDEQRLVRIDPEKLVVIEPAELPALFTLHYPDLKDRAAAMLAACQKWQAAHKGPTCGIIDVKDDEENGQLGDLIRQLDDFTGEVDEARKRVKLRVFEAGKQIDGWFNGTLADPVAEIRGVTRTVSGKRYPPGPGTMQFAQTKYLTDKAERERQAREAAAQAAAREAKRKEDEARRLAQEEAQRIADLQAEGAAAEEAQEIAQYETDQAAAAADAARASSSLIGAFAEEPASALVRQQTATGTTVGLAGRWTFEVVDLPALCLAVGAAGLTREDLVNRVAAASMIGVAGVRAVLQATAQVLTQGGAIPPTFIATDDKNIRAALTARTAPLRQAPGLRIYQEQSARRSLS
jgi:hypothetical protein